MNEVSHLYPKFPKDNYNYNFFNQRHSFNANLFPIFIEKNYRENPSLDSFAGRVANWRDYEI